MIEVSELKKVIEYIENKAKKKGTFFSAKTIKKDGSERVFNCRLGVKKHLKGGEPAYDYDEKNHLCVWDKVVKDYRNVNCNTIRRLQVVKHLLIENGEPTKNYERIKKLISI